MGVRTSLGDRSDIHPDPLRTEPRGAVSDCSRTGRKGPELGRASLNAQGVYWAPRLAADPSGPGGDTGWHPRTEPSPSPRQTSPSPCSCESFALILFLALHFPPPPIPGRFKHFTALEAQFYRTSMPKYSWFENVGAL